MFEFIKKAKREYVGTTIFVTKNEDVTVEKFMTL